VARAGQDATNVGDEGGFAPSINSTTEGLDLIVAAIAVRPRPRGALTHADAWLVRSAIGGSSGLPRVVRALQAEPPVPGLGAQPVCALGRGAQGGRHPARGPVEELGQQQLLQGCRDCALHLRSLGAAQQAGYEGKVKIGMDVAASEFMTEDKKYDLNFKVKDNDGSQVLSGCAAAQPRPLTTLKRLRPVRGAHVAECTVTNSFD